MFLCYQDFKSYFTNDKIFQLEDGRFTNSIKKFSFTSALDLEKCDNKIHDNINNVQFIIVDEYFELDEKYIIACLNREIIIFDHSKQMLIQDLLFQKQNENKIYFVPKDNKSQKKKEYKDAFEFIAKTNEDKIYFETEIYKLNEYLQIKTKNKKFLDFWKIICPCIATYLILKNYININKNQLKNFVEKIDEQNELKELKVFEYDEFVKLRMISSMVILFYHIESEKIFAFKFFEDKLFEREFANYKVINHPFLPKFDGIIKDKNCLVMEFIHGQSLSDSNLNKMDIQLKLKIIIDILFIFQYLHQNNFIYRDLKPDNLILNSINQIILIDFDRMIKNPLIVDYSLNKINEYTKDFDHEFVDPEMIKNNSIPSFKNDIYSIGKIISFILTGKSQNMNEDKFKSLINNHTINRFKL